MQRLVSALAGRRARSMMVLAAVSMSTAAVFIARSTQVDAASFVLIATLIGLALTLLIGFGAMLAGVDPDVPRIASSLGDGADARRLLTRWLSRTRWFRNVAGASGVTWWLFGTSAQGDLLLCGVVGVAMGSMAAQLHHARPSIGRRTASLERRSVAAYLSSSLQRQLAGVVLAAVAVAVVASLVDQARPALVWAAGAIVVVAVSVVVVFRVAGRPRPVLPLGLQQADDLLRELAIGRGLAQPAIYCALAMLAHGVGRLSPVVGGWATLGSVLAWLVALRLWWRNRGLGLEPAPTTSVRVSTAS